MFLGLLTLITALSISAVAIYYSVAGLMTIFAAAAVPIMIMGGILEVAKLVTAVWLHRYWQQATWWLKTYLTTAVIVLMFITSMGIFGFLSKAHIEQTASANQGIAQIERIQSEILRNQQVIERAELKIQELESKGTGASNQLQSQIDREQTRIDSAYTRIQPAIDEQNQIIDKVTELFQQELSRIDDELDLLQNYIDNNEIEKAQAMVGTKVDGDYGPKTAAAFTAYQDRKTEERNDWLEKIQNASQSSTVIAARQEIARLRSNAEEQIAQSNALINNLRNQLKSNDTNNLQTILNEQNERVRSASNEIDQLLDTKFQLEAEYRKLEAEVGPVKYIAEFIYGENADNNLLEEAVRWVIITIIFVFDPLAVLLLIAAQYTFEFSRKRKDDHGDWLRQYEQARAQRIVDNPGFTNIPPWETKGEKDRRETREEESQDAEKLRTGQNEESIPPETRNNPDVDQKETGQVDGRLDIRMSSTDSARAGDNGRDTTDGVALARGDNIDWDHAPSRGEKYATANNTTADDSMGNVVSKDDTTNTDVSDIAMEQDETQSDEDQSEIKYVQNSEQSDSTLWKSMQSRDIPDTRNRMFYPEELDKKSNSKLK